MPSKTALVTGASEGIGLEFCRILAAEGYQLVLVARREEKLHRVAELISAQYAVSCHVIAADLARPDAAERLFQTTREQQLHIDFLVNNAGLLFNGFFTDLPLDGQQQLMTVNMMSLAALSHLFANDMQKRGGGHILNVASTAAWMPIPNQNIYAASKAFVLSFTLALANELKAAGSNVSACALCPGYTETRMLDNPAQGARLRLPSSLLTDSANAVARHGVNACLQGKSCTIPGLGNRVIAVLLQIMPKRMVTALVGRLYRNLLE